MIPKVPLITVVLSTYNRPHVLKYAVLSVQQQTVQDWELLVIGDCCDSRTEEVMSRFKDDKRIKYINLSRRCGSQALPNSAGMLLSKSEYVALLNHDDLWLPDHLEKALSTLQNQNADLYFSNVASVRNMLRNCGIEEKPVFTKINRDHTLKDAYHDYLVLEPASCWVIKRELINKVGPWHSDTEIYRHPIQDWALRAWRCGANLVRDETITCLRVATHKGDSRKQILYNTSSNGQKVLLEIINNNRQDKVRKYILDNIEISNKNKNYITNIDSLKKYEYLSLKLFKYVVRKMSLSLTKVPLWADIYYKTGFDFHYTLNKIIRTKKEKKFESMLKKRVNEKIEKYPSLEDILLEVDHELKTSF